MTDWGDLYRQHVDAITGLAPELSEQQLATTVPATPQWNVQNLLAHLAGESADLVDDRMEGAPNPEWTQRQVADRADADASELVAELRQNTDAVAASVSDADVPSLAWDIAVHHADLHEALGKGRLPDDLWRPVVDALRPNTPEEVRDVDPYELFRGAFSRRSRAQMAGWGTGADAETLDKMCVFGPREDDQPVV